MRWGALGLALAGSALVSGALWPRTLQASGTTCPDTDGDGLNDIQESILGTDPDKADTDEDGFPDLEEVARSSNPMDFVSTPDLREISIGMTARAEDGVITIVAPVFARAGSFGEIALELGFIFPDGTRYELLPELYLPVIKGGVFMPASEDYSVVLLEMPVPQRLLSSLGSLSIYGIVKDAEGRDNISASTINLVDFGGVPVVAQNAPPGVGGGGGVVYGPLIPASDIPPSWSSGELCWHQASPVGMIGSSTAYEVTKGLCVPSDTFCGASECTSRVGSSVLLVDPGTLLGG